MVVLYRFNNKLIKTNNDILIMTKLLKHDDTWAKFDGNNYLNMIRNIKIWDNNGTLRYFFPMTDNNSKGKDVITKMVMAEYGSHTIIDI